MSHTPSPPAPAIGLISLGCAKNLVDSEHLSAALLARGYRIEAQYEQCDLVIVNTCGFINPAIGESLEAIGEALDEGKKVLVMGCLGTRADFVRAHYPQVVGVYGPGRRAAVLRGIEKAVGLPPTRPDAENTAVTLTPSHYAYLKIAEGCRHRCTFCVIPSLRGPLRSRLPEAILREARSRIAAGARELLVIAQDSSDYGFDLPGTTDLPALLRELSTLGVWLRVHYVYPTRATERLVELMAEGRILPYLDAPLQHVNLRLLREMKRPGSLEATMRQIENWRSICPEIAIRSTFITGFPGETEEEFSELLDFLREARLDRVGCFPYSPVEGAEANALPGAVDEDTRNERAAILMETQEQISADKLAERIGTTEDVLIDEVTEEGEAIGRSRFEAPDVDGIISIPHAPGVKPGQMVRVRITGSDIHDLEGELQGPTPIPFSTAR